MLSLSVCVLDIYILPSNFSLFFRLYSLDYRFALIPNAGLGHAHASMGATLALRICRLFNAPVDGFEPLADKIVICLAEVLASEKSAVCRERARVRGGQDEVPSIRGDEDLFFDGETAPEQKDEVLADLRKSLDNRVCELLPTNAGVACCHVGAHRERGVQEQNSLMRPAFQVPMGRWRDAEIVMEFLENVDEGRQRLDSEWH